MADTKFTFAELATIAAEEPGWKDLQSLLAIPDADGTVKAAGMSSLLVRELARISDGEIAIRKDVRENVDLLLRPSRAIWLTRADASGINAAVALVPESGAQTCLASLGGPGIYGVTPLLKTDEVVIQLRDLVMALSGDGRTAITLGSKADTNGVLVGHDGGVWTFGLSRDDGETHEKTSDEAVVAAWVEEKLRVWLDA